MQETFFFTWAVALNASELALDEEKAEMSDEGWAASLQAHS